MMENTMTDASNECERRWKKFVEDRGESYDKNDLLLNHVKYDGSRENIECILEHLGADVNYNKTPSRYSVLHVAAYNGSTDLVKKLISKGADLNCEDEHGRTPLVYAVNGGHVETAELLIGLSDRSLDGQELLVSAVDRQFVSIESKRTEFGTIQMIRFLSRDVLGISGNSQNGNDRSASMALHRAASVGQYHDVGDILKELIEIGADINYSSADGSTPLIAATSNGQHKNVDKLIQLGANVNVELDGRNPMDIAVEREDFEMIGVFAKRGLMTKQIDAKEFAYSKDIREPEIFKSVYAVKWLVSNGANVDIGIEENDTALLRAVNWSVVELARTLIELGARTDIVEQNGKNLLDIAIDRSNPEMIESLLDTGLNCDKPNSKDSALNRSLRNAAKEGNCRLVRYLISIGADVTFFEGYIDPFDVAIGSKSIEMLNLLIEGGLNVNSLNPNGKPYLAVAIEKGSKQVVDYLLEKGIDYWVCTGLDHRSPLWFCTHESDVFSLFDDENDDERREIMKTLLDHVEKREGKDNLIKYINHRDIRGQTVLHFYSERGDSKLVEYLVKLGGHIDCEDKWGRTPLICALQNGHIGTGDLLYRLGAKTNIEVDGKDLLTLAIESKQLNMIRFVLRDVFGISKSTTNGNDVRASKALYRASCLGLDWEILSELIGNGADIEYKSDDGSTPLIAATRNRHHKIVDKLIQMGANVDVEMNGQNVMDIAVEMENFELIGILATKGLTTEHIDAKQFASSKDIREPQIFKCTDVVKWLVSNGANIDIGIEENDTALSRAVGVDKIELVRTLIELGAKTDILVEGKTLLDIAIDTSDYPETIELLLDAGLQCDKRQPKDRGLNLGLNNAASWGNCRVVRFLVDIGADVNYRVEELALPLFEAVRSGEIETCSLLIKLGADTNIDIDGENLLDMAIRSKRVEMIEWVLKLGSFNINGLNPSGKPYLSVAIEREAEKVVEYMLENGVDYWLCSEPDKRSPLWSCHRNYSTFWNRRTFWKMGCEMLLDHVKKRQNNQALIRYMNHQDSKGQTVLHFYSHNGQIELVELLLSLGADTNIADHNQMRPQDLAKTNAINRLLISHLNSTECG